MIYYNAPVCISLVMCICQGKVEAAEAFCRGHNSISVSVMTYNVENLFDAQHQRGKNDFTFLPLDLKAKLHWRQCSRQSFSHRRQQCQSWDWTPAVVQEKLRRIGAVIKSYGRGLGPDILVIQEVENKALLTELARGPLGQSDYKTIALLEGTDPRGIDIGILARFPPAGEPEFLFYDRFRRPGLLQRLKTSLGTLSILGVHLPSPLKNLDLEIHRKFFDWLLRSLPELTKQGPLIIAGDFNMPGSQASPKNGLFKAFFEATEVAHEGYCNGCLGTHYYASRKRWSFLDSIIIPKQIGALIKPGSVRVVRTPENTAPGQGIPRRFTLEHSGEIQGVSDHFPLVASAVLRTPPIPCITQIRD